MKRPATNLGQTVENLLLMEGYRYAPPSGWHAHASLGPRAKEEAALGGRREGTRCIVRVEIRFRIVLPRATGAFRPVAGLWAICVRLARGKAPVLVRFEAGLGGKGFIRGQFVVAEVGGDRHLRRLLALEQALGVGHGLEGGVRAVVGVC
jgi:hypothetical protein